MGNIDFDTYGCPEFFMNVPVTEPAGGGNVRVWNCVRRGGVLMPVCAVVIPAEELLVACQIITKAAMETYKREREILLSAH